MSAEVSRACRTAVQKRPTHAQPTVFGRISKREGQLLIADSLVTQCVDGIEGGGFSRGVEAEENPDGGAEKEDSDDG